MKLRKVLLSLLLFALISLLTPMLIQHFLGESLTTAFLIKLEKSPLMPFSIPVLPQGAYLTIGMIISGASLSLYTYYSEKLAEESELKRQALELLSIVIAYVKAGSSMLDALEKSTRHVGRPLLDPLERFIEAVKLGTAPDEAYRKAFKRPPSEVGMVFSSITIGMKSGGQYANILMQGENYLMQVLRMDELRRSRLADYKAIVLLAVIAFAISAFASLKLVEYIATASTIFPAVSEVNLELLKSSYYISVLITAITSSIVIGRVVVGSVIASLKYISFSTAIVALIFTLYPLIHA
ncbi:MAG: type II secretion system F family protein [Sulfolobales archaeon]|nr:type II secretion system F family protein [Sulfolobales archaeon]